MRCRVRFWLGAGRGWGGGFEGDGGEGVGEFERVRRWEMGGLWIGVFGGVVGSKDVKKDSMNAMSIGYLH